MNKFLEREKKREIQRKDGKREEKGVSTLRRSLGMKMQILDKRKEEIKGGRREKWDSLYFF